MPAKKKSIVYFTSARRTRAGGPYQKFKLLIQRSGVLRLIKKNETVAIKLHMGERGGVRYIRPTYVNLLVDMVKGAGGRPFVTDANVLYPSGRKSFSDHIDTIRKNGFTSETMGCPVIIADGVGLSGTYIEVRDPLRLEKVKLAQAIYDADFLISLAHVTLHVEFPIAAAIKNVGMGCVTQESKREMHSQRSEIKHLAAQEATVDGAKAIFSKFKEKSFSFNIAMDITKDCDCLNKTDVPIVPDIGILASVDPVAIDRASFDMIRSSVGYPTSSLDGKRGYEAGGDKIKALFPKIDVRPYWEIFRRTSFGNPDYEVVEIG